MILEARYGMSEVQNYDAIARNTAFAASTRLAWRFVILVLTGLPIGLSIGYKQFTSGTATNTVPSMNGRYYQMTGPPGISLIGSGGGIALAMNATIPILAVSSCKMDPWTCQHAPPEAPLDDLPRAYGFNNLLLSNTSAAFLDIHTEFNLTALQNLVKEDELLTISAKVNAMVATYNNEIDQHRWDLSWWAKHQGDGAWTQTMYNHYDVVYMAPEWGMVDESWAIVGFVGDDSWNHFYKTALLYKIQRQKRDGTWDITKTSIVLKSGSCDDNAAKLNQSIYTNAELIVGSFFMNFIQQAMNPFAPPMLQANSTWRTPAWTTVVAAIFWARPQFVTYTPWTDFTTFYIEDEVRLTRPVMSDEWVLYLVLVAQPVITLAFLLCGIFLYSTPIGKGFGLVSILAGADADSLKILDGAGLSGEIRTPIRMDICVTDLGLQGQKNPELGQVRYRFGLGDSGSTKTTLGQIKRGQVYG